MNPLRFFRTLEHMNVGQAAARVRHELWLRTRRKRGWPAPGAAARDREDSHGPPVLHREARLPVPDEEFVRLDALADRWERGAVEYLGVEASSSDWLGEGKLKLWRYERQYQTELVALAVRAHGEPKAAPGPWTLAARALQESWALACPPERGDAWEPYPVARRILSWAEALAIEPNIATPATAERLSFQLAHLAAHLEHHLRGNHLLCDAAALVAGGALLAGGAGDAAMGLGARLLETELAAQTLPDGGYAERTAQYHSIVLKDALLALELSRARRLELQPRIEELLGKMAMWLWRARRPDATWPLVNDAAPHASLLAREALARAERLHLFAAPTPIPNVELPDTGWTFVRDVGCELFFDTGLIGPRDQPGHGHADALAYELRWYGVPVVCDTGITTYERNAVREFERSAAAHATVSVGGAGIDEVWASFRVGGRGKSEKVAIATIDPRVRTLRGIARSYRGFTHERTLVFWPARALLVFDKVTRAPRGAQVLSHVPLASGWSAAPASGSLFLLGPGARALQLHLLNGAVDGLPRGSESPRDGWVSEGFGKPVARTSVRLCADESGLCAYAIVAPGVTTRQTSQGLSLRAPGAEIALRLENGTPCASST